MSGRSSSPVGTPIANADASIAQTGTNSSNLRRGTSLRRSLHRLGIQARIARVQIEPTGTLVRHRWVIDRTLAWLQRFRRLAIRSERQLDIHQDFLTLGSALNYIWAPEQS
mgnify:CR=1 FL=1